jgi:PilZ domain
MSTPAFALDTGSLGTSRPDNRLHPRYPIELAAEFTLLPKGQTTRRGVGTTLNISSGGLLFACTENLPPGAEIEVTIQWPFLLDGARPLRLRVTGHIVRSNGMGVAVQTSHCEFRTAPKTPRV